MGEKKSKDAKLNYGWVILGLIFGNLFVEGGVRNTQPVLLPALTHRFGGSAAMTSAIFSASGIVGGFTAPILGKMLDRIGPRYMFPLAGTFILLGWWASSTVSQGWQLFVFYSFIATLGHTAIGSFSATAVLAPWFPRSKGVMLGLADSGNPTGQAVITPLAQLIISRFGWRVAFQVVGLVFFLMTAPLNFLLQRKPPDPDAGLSVFENNESVASNIDLPEAVPESALSDAYTVVPEVQEFYALREPAVWLLLISRATGTISHQMTHLHIIAFLVFAGYGEMQSAAALGVAGLIGIVARPSFGILSDKIGREIVFTITMGMTFLSISVVILFTGGASLWALISFVALTGFSDGLSGLILGAKAADLYPSNTLGTVMGVVDVGRGIGWATGGILTGLMFDKYGDYTFAYWTAASIALLSIAALWSVRLLEPKR